MRTRRIAERTALTNQLRGILSEHGVWIGRGPAQLKRYLAKDFLVNQELSPTIRVLVVELQAELGEIERRIGENEKLILARAKACPVGQRLMTIPGIGLLSATAPTVASGDPKQFENGRQFSAWLGLVPRQFSTGGKTILRGITKRGDAYVRCLLIHGARSVVYRALRKDNPHSLWIRKLHAAEGTNLTAVAAGGHSDAVEPMRNRSAYYIMALLSK